MNRGFITSVILCGWILLSGTSVMGQLSRDPVHVDIHRWPTPEAQIAAAKRILATLPRTATPYERSVAIATAAGELEMVFTTWPDNAEAGCEAALTESDIFASAGLSRNAEQVLRQHEKTARSTTQAARFYTRVAEIELRLGNVNDAIDAVTTAEGTPGFAAMRPGEKFRALNTAASAFERSGRYEEAALRLRRLAGEGILDEMTAADMMIRTLSNSTRMADKTLARRDLADLEGRFNALQRKPSHTPAQDVVLRRLASALQRYHTLLGAT